MATTATINLSSSDLMGNFPMNWSASTTLTKAGSNDDIAETTGLARRKLAATTKVDLVEFADTTITADKSAKIYIKNTGTDESRYVQVFINSVEIGRLYGGEGGLGDWMLMPYAGGSGEDIEVAPSHDDAVVLEYMVFFE